MYKRGKKIDYHNRDLSNPFFRQKKKKRINFSTETMPFKKKLFIAEIIILFFGTIWLIGFSSIFSIKKIEITGLVRIPGQEIENSIWQQTKLNKFLFIPQKNLIFFDKSDLVEKLNVNYSFEKIIINKKLLHTLSIDIQEKSYAFIWNETDKYYYADMDGYLISEVSPLDIKEKKYPIISNESENRIGSENQGGVEKIDIDSNLVNYIINLFNNFPSDSEKQQEGNDTPKILKIEKFAIDLNKEPNTVKVVLAYGPVILFNTSEAPDKQIEKLLLVKNEKLKDDFYNKQSIDLRYGSSIYYR
jgi:hypothetical protein